MTLPEMACGINVYCSGTDDPGFPAALEDMAALGYSHIALAPLDPATDIAALKTALDAAGIRPIPMSGQAPEADVSSPDADIRAKGLDLLKAAIDTAHQLGADQINGVAYGLFGDRATIFAADRLARSAELVGQAADYAKQAGIVMTFEVLNRYETAMLNTAEQAIGYVKAAGSDNLRIHLDTFHMGVEEADIPAAITAALPWLGYLELGQSGRGSLATGAVDIPGVIGAAKAAGYTGRFGLEAFSRQILDPGTADALAIWRQTFTDSHQVAAEAIDLVRGGYSQ